LRLFRELPQSLEEIAVWYLKACHSRFHTVPNSLSSQSLYHSKMIVFWDVDCVVSQKLTGTYCLQALMKEAVSTSEMSINFYETTRRNIPEDSHLHDKLRYELHAQWAEREKIKYNWYW
jgi:hypothetical protein